jgi:hypothetical protein
LEEVPSVNLSANKARYFASLTAISLWPKLRLPSRSFNLHNVTVTIRRLKTYAGTQGFVYQYYFVGRRAALAGDAEGPGTEFIFDVTSDRKQTYAVSILLPDAATREWSAGHGRSLTDSEQYAAAKLRLFRAFDELENVMAEGRRLVIKPTMLEESLANLGVE